MNTFNYKRITILLSALLLVSCATTELGNTKIAEAGRYMQLNIDESTKRDVYLVFGQPMYVSYDENDSSVWVYKKIDMTPSGWSYVPFWGLVVGGQNVEEEVAYFEFSSEGVLSNISNRANGGYVNTWVGLMGGGVQDDEPEDAYSVKDEMSKYSLPYNKDRDPLADED
jgi:outer membrane protein assembly factor BamE (lipoprotein component of BamABCDE complex)